MADAISITGLKEAQKALYSYSRDLGDNVIRRALRQGANLVLKQARANAPVRTGRLKRALRIITSKRNKGKGSGIIGVRLTYRAGKSRTDPRGAYYALIVEGGWERGGRRIQGQYYGKRAFESHSSAAATLIASAAIAGANVVARKTGLK